MTKDGIVRCYYDLQGDFTQFSLGNGAEEFGVQSCRCVDCLLAEDFHAYTDAG